MIEEPGYSPWGRKETERLNDNHNNNHAAPEPQRPHLRCGARYPWISQGFRKIRGVLFVRHAAYEVELQERAAMRLACE